MFLKTLRSLGHTLALRLTLWYAGIFAASSIVAFTLVYASVVAVVQVSDRRGSGRGHRRVCLFYAVGWTRSCED